MKMQLQTLKNWLVLLEAAKSKRDWTAEANDLEDDDDINKTVQLARDCIDHHFAPGSEEHAHQHEVLKSMRGLHGIFDFVMDYRSTNTIKTDMLNMIRHIHKSAKNRTIN